MSESHAKALISGLVVSYPIIEKTILFAPVAQFGFRATHFDSLEEWQLAIAKEIEILVQI